MAISPVIFVQLRFVPQFLSQLLGFFELRGFFTLSHFSGPRCPERGWHVLIGPGDGGSKPEDEADLAFLPLPPPRHDRGRGRLSLEERGQPGLSQLYQVWC